MENFDKLYNDIIINVLPKIQEWLVITKDYAFDLFERYINYLLISDIISSIWFIILTIVFIYFIPILNKGRIKANEDKNWNEWLHNTCFWFYIFICVTFVFITFDSILYIIKDLYIPEVRIYEYINNSINKK